MGLSGWLIFSSLDPRHPSKTVTYHDLTDMKIVKKGTYGENCVDGMVRVKNSVARSFCKVWNTLHINSYLFSKLHLEGFKRVRLCIGDVCKVRFLFCP